MIGNILASDTSLSTLERLYIRLFGVPINGLRIRARRILPYLVPKYHRILDAGCGQGVFTFEAARRLPASLVTGMDANSGLIERNRRIADAAGLSNCRFECGDIAAIPADSRYDLILSIDVLEHIEDDIGVLTGYYRALEPQGELLLHVPGYYRRWPLFSWRVNFEVEGHCRPGYTMDDITGKVEGAGFAVIERYHTYGWLETMTNNISYAITGAKMKRKGLYTLVFPILLFISYFGRNSRPERGAGVFIHARKQ